MVRQISMDTPSSSMRDLARRVLAASQTGGDPHVHQAALVTERLRDPLTRFAGPDGFVALLRRAVALASAEAPALRRIVVGADGRLEGLDRMVGEAGPGAEAEAAVAITTQLLGLLVTFVGEPFTLRLVREAWPDMPTGDFNSGSGADA